MIKTLLAMLTSASMLLVLAGAGGNLSHVDGKNATEPAVSVETAPAQDPPAPPVSIPEAAAAAPLYYIDWYSVNSGGDHNLSGTTYDLGVTVGEAVAGFVTGTQFDVGLGFWYGSGLCPIVLSGDVNLNGTLGTSDIITMVNYALKGGPDPLPCVGNGDANCDGTISLSDIIVLVNRVLKGGPDPCDVCTVIPSLWNCP